MIYCMYLCNTVVKKNSVAITFQLLTSNFAISEFYVLLYYYILLFITYNVHYVPRK